MNLFLVLVLHMSDFLNAFEAFLAKPGAENATGRSATSGGVVVKESHLLRTLK